MVTTNDGQRATPRAIEPTAERSADVTATVGDYLDHLERAGACPPDLEERFVDVARDYSSMNGISRTAWLTVGVPAPVLDAAGITR
ncbi:MAG: hypothetical protein AB7H43_15250 [Acidimicrobiia bacterium]